jgi:hypothetical protein
MHTIVPKLILNWNRPLSVKRRLKHVRKRNLNIAKTQSHNTPMEAQRERGCIAPTHS